jgi:CheY-like chemotaxis protein
MLVDDQDDLRRLARMMIEVEVAAESGGVRVTEVSSGRDAITRCLSEPVDVMVLDMMMPGVDGLAVLRSVNKLLGRPCVIAWSGDDRALQRAVDLGAELAVNKNDVDGLTRGIRTCLQYLGIALA